MGLRGIPETEIRFENLEVPDEMVLQSPEGRLHGFADLMNAYNSQRVGAATVALGLAQGAFEAAIAFAKERHQFGRPIGEFQGLQWMLADMAIQLNAARLAVYRAAASADPFPDPLLAAQAKVFASEMAIKVTNDALQMFGARGYSRDYPMERMARDARMFTIGGGTAQVLRNFVAGRVLGLEAAADPRRLRGALIRQRQPRAQRLHDGGVHRVDGAIRCDQHAAFRCRRGDVAKALVHPSMEQRVELLIPIGIGAALQLPRDRHRIAHIQHQRNVGNDAEQPGQRRDRGAVSTKAVALIRHRRIEEPIADHPHPGRQRRPDRLLHMFGPSGKVQQHLSRRGPVRRIAEQEVAQNLRPRRTARLARPQYRQTKLHQRIRQQPSLSGLAGALATLQRYEPPEGHPALLLSLRGAQRRSSLHRDRFTIRPSHNATAPLWRDQAG